ncbi:MULTISPECIES: LCP family protein [unclassified Streptomyces]|uniref:LCP family protein n=1 Tax=unclassified Streptomyces TaxID=2593676 RepID=UPI0022B66A6B|nr:MULTISPECIES: LCP family protein [unclassified Streptomyces]MCZ7416038.1 LCP family protein [Streptomyces sp. WMMC897]MCZ7434155.1 LCP family protein [Streptomyces sp. WMMC1477]
MRRASLLALCGALSALFLLTPGVGRAEQIDVFGGIAEHERPAPGRGLNVLLVGSDTRDGLSRAEKNRLHVGGVGCDCADVMMLVHLSDRRDRVSVVSIPRDSYLPFAPHREPGGQGGHEDAGVRHSGKVNAALKHGGPPLLVRSLERATGVRIDHYAELDFGSFERAVDGFGDAPVCTVRPMRDSGSGLSLSRGTHTLDGRRGLRYVRARKIGWGVPGDMGRMRRQQHFVAGLVEGLAGRGAFSDARRLRELAGVAHSAARVDQGLSPARMVEFGRWLHGIRRGDMEFATVPISDFDHRVPGWGSTLLWDDAAAVKMFGRIRADLPLVRAEEKAPDPGREPGRDDDDPAPVLVDPRSIPVQVHDASGRDGTGAEADRALRATGFATTGTPLSAGPAERTVIEHGPAAERAARALATALPSARLRLVETGDPATDYPARGEPTLQVYLGADHQGVRPVRYARNEAEGGAVTGDELACL